MAAADREFRERLLAKYRAVRSESERICRPLAIEDWVVQSMPQTSPPKWHLAHTAWFFETFLLKPFLAGYHEVHPQYAYLFNSYYDSVGAQYPRARRGLLSRPTVGEVRHYRTHVDLAMERLLTVASAGQWAEVEKRTALGLHHEQQHQELLLTDIKHNFAANPLRPAYHLADARSSGERTAQWWVEFDAAHVSVGSAGEDFCFDNEMPRHRVWLEGFRLASRLVTNREYLQFVADNGYERPELWLVDGWAATRENGWRAPLYWEDRDGEWWYMTLAGMRPLGLEEPVCHVSYYEAEAFARWANKRLPREEEWEYAANGLVAEGNLLDSDQLHPRPATPGQSLGLRQMFGDVWEWTQSPYLPYPGYRRVPGAFGEYNGKFMCNQMVLRGGSCVTPRGHIRSTYRNFFYPDERWQFSGIRLAE